MSLHSDLLSQAHALLNQERRRPKQASLRRAVSTAYYALFHLLINESSTMLVSNTALRLMVSRTFTHTEMTKASKSFAGGTLPNKFGPVTSGAPIPQQLRDVARAFVELQQARQEADYNLAKSFTKGEAKALLDQTTQAFQDWQTVRRNDDSRLFLTCLLLWDRWDKLK